MPGKGWQQGWRQRGLWGHAMRPGAGVGFGRGVWGGVRSQMVAAGVKAVFEIDVVASPYLASSFAVQHSNSYQGSFLGHPHHPAHSCGPNVCAMPITIRCVFAVCCKARPAHHTPTLTSSLTLLTPKSLGSKHVGSCRRWTQHTGIGLDHKCGSKFWGALLT